MEERSWGVRALGALSVEDVVGLLGPFGAAAFARYGVRTAAVRYRTRGVGGEPVVASGLLAVPVGVEGDRDVVVFHHGTTVEKREAPSTPEHLTTRLLAPFFASCGFVFVAPDYVGLGADAPGRHPYLHAATEVTASLDMLEAARGVCAREFGMGWTSRLFLTGFSQGGQATLAVQRAIEADAGSALEVVASAPVAGPYSLSAVTAPTVFREPGVNTSLYLAYVMTAYQEIYGIYDSPADAFVPPYDGIVHELFDGHHTSDEVQAALPATPDLLIRGDWWQAAMGDEGHPFARALRENDTDDFAPRAPVRLYAGTADEDVPAENAFAAARAFTGRGSVAEVVDVGPVDHEATAFVAFPLIRAWFAEWGVRGED